MKSTQEKSGDEDNFSLLDWIVLISLTILIAYYVYSLIKEIVNYQFDVSLKELRVNISRIISLCESDADCGLSGYVGSPYCYGDSIMRDYLNVSCKNPGRKNARCENRTEFVKINSCRREDEVCSEGECLKISCTNGVWDLGEIGVDCGGFCKSCVGNKTPITPKPKK